MKKKREELQRKRGALGSNNDLDIDPDFTSGRNYPRSGGPSNAVSYKSKLHQDIKYENLTAKQQLEREYAEKVQKNERVKNYSKNVKEMYMPDPKQRNNSVNAERKYIQMGMHHQ